MNLETFKKYYYQTQSAYVSDFLKDSQEYKKAREALYRLLKTSTKKDPFLMQLRVSIEPRVAALMTTLKSATLDKDKQIVKHLELLKRRNQLAKDEGFDDYKAMMMDFDDVKEVHLKTMLAVYLKKQEKQRKALVKRYRITADNLADVIDTIGPKVQTTDPSAFLSKVIKKLDLTLKREVLSITVDPTISCFKSITTSPQKTQLLTPKIKTMADLKNFIHELSKSLLSVYHIQASQKSFLRPQKILGLSRIIEHAIIDNVCTRKERRWLKKILILENAYHSLHGLFEFDLPDQKKSPNAYYESLITEVFELYDQTRWAYEKPLIEAPLTQMMLPLGTVAYQNLSKIYKTDKKARLKFGPWLENNLFDRIDEVEMNTIL